MDHIIIRSETIKDYFKIAEIHALAFANSNGMGEVLLVDAMRHRKTFDQELSLVAEIDGEVIGHVLFTPLQIIVGGIEQKAVNLAPIAIHPSYQKLGIGSLLIEEGHQRCKEKGFEFCILLGHPNYYSRFGYQTSTYGAVAITINREIITAYENVVEVRRVEQRDLSFLQSTWEKMVGKENLTIKPGNIITDWISTSNKITSIIIEDNQTPIGYVRYETKLPSNISYFLANDQHAATTIINYMNSLVPEEVESITLPIHPNSEWTKANITFPYQASINAWRAGMIKILNTDNQHISDYCQKVLKDEEQIGLISWPVEFDNC